MEKDTAGTGEMLCAKTSKVTLPFDIWHMVFAELAKQDTEAYHLILDQEDKDRGHYIEPARDRSLLSPAFRSWARSLRLTSRDFNTILKPYVYQQIDISRGSSTAEILAANSSVRTEIKQNILTHTRRLQTTSYPIQDVIGFLQSCRRLKTYAWNETNLDPVEGRRFHSMLVNAMARKWHNIQFRSSYPSTAVKLFTIEDAMYPHSMFSGPIKWSSGRDCSEFIDQPPGHCLTSFMYSNHRPNYPFDHFVDVGTPLPPMEELILREYSWVHSEADYKLIWDFSRLRSLEVSATGGDNNKIAPFFRTVPAAALKFLQKLSIWALSEDDPRLARSFLRTLFKEMQDLENITMDIGKWNDIVPISSLVKAGRCGSRIRRLQLLSGLVETNLITVSDLKMLISCCPNMEILIIALPLFPTSWQPGFGAEEFIEILATFESLQYLILQAQYNLGTISPEESHSIDPDREDAERILKFLRGSKRGVPFRRVGIDLRFWTQSGPRLLETTRFFSLEATESDIHEASGGWSGLRPHQN